MFLLNLLFSIFITAFVYLLAPTILAITKIKLSKKAIVLFVIINALCCFIAFIILHWMLNDGGKTNVIAMFIWSSIAYALLKKTSYKDNDTEDADPVVECMACGYKGDFQNACPKCGKTVKRYIYPD